MDSARLILNPAVHIYVLLSLHQQSLHRRSLHPVQPVTSVKTQRNMHQSNATGRHAAGHVVNDIHSLTCVFADELACSMSSSACGALCLVNAALDSSPLELILPATAKRSAHSSVQVAAVLKEAAVGITLAQEQQQNKTPPGAPTAGHC